MFESFHQYQFMKLDKETILGFSGSILSERYDSPKPTPDCHMEFWDLCCLEDKQVAIAAPRGHAKSTAITHAYGLASALFMTKRNIMILSDTEDQAKQFLHDIKVELTENQVLIREFDVHPLVKESESEIIVSMGNAGHQFRIFAKGAGQKLRGAKWRGMRPDLVLGDDMENDEQVVSKERRLKFRKWVLGAVIPLLSDSGQIRIVGTILHADSFLENCLNSKYWTSKRYEAHNDDFSEILWPEKYPKERLQAIRDYYEEQGELEIYAQEFRNIPIDDSVAIFRNSDFLPLDEAGFDEYLEYYVGVDCAISKSTKADYTVLAVVGVNTRGIIKVKEIIKARLDGTEIVDEIFRIEKRYRPQMFVVEDENISKAIGPFLYEEMPRRGLFPIIETLRPSKDLLIRVRSWVARMRAGAVQFDKDAEWYADLYTELKMFPRGKNDDIVSSFSLLGLKLRAMFEADQSNEFEDWDDDDEDWDNEDDYYYDGGKCISTGY